MRVDGRRFVGAKEIPAIAYCQGDAEGVFFCKERGRARMKKLAAEFYIENFRAARYREFLKDIFSMLVYRAIADAEAACNILALQTGLYQAQYFRFA